MKGIIRAVLYDLDGTIIQTEGLHERAWLHAGKQVQKKITGNHLKKQKGISNEDAAQIILGEGYGAHGGELVRHKNDFVVSNVQEIEFYEDFLDALILFKKNKIKVGIVTSSPLDFVNSVFSNIPQLAKLSKYTIHREKYVSGKPSAEPILRACIELKLRPEEVIYVGDAFADYESAMNAGCGFVHFARNERDRLIPKVIPSISKHPHIKKHLK